VRVNRIAEDTGSSGAALTAATPCRQKNRRRERVRAGGDVV
jgi:hypothetical protein